MTFPQVAYLIGVAVVSFLVSYGAMSFLFGTPGAR